MTTWTDPARQRLDRYFEQTRAALQASGADPEEVCEDLRRHIQEEVALRKLAVVTEEDIRQILTRIGAPEVPAPKANPPPPVADASAPKKAAGAGKTTGHWWLLIFSVILPLVTLGIELTTRMCAGVFFDPIPSIWHVFMVAAVPLSNLWAWRVVRTGESTLSAALKVANGYAIGIAAFYTLLFLPILPFAVIGVFYIGWGLLPMAPLFALIGALVLRGYLKRISMPAKPFPGIWTGLGLAALALALTVLPITATRYWTSQAGSGSPAQATRAVKWLRWLGSDTTLLGDCYGSSSWMRQSPIDLHLFGVPVSPERARAVYFRVTGRSFNTVPPPQLNFARGGWNLLDDFTWDLDQGGSAVGSRVKGLFLTTSRFDGLVESDAAIGYLEWTLEFRNESRQAREARAQIALPSGGVVSRVTLWIDGEEREAAFAGRAQVREAYKEVAVRQRRDPVLVTSAGPDRVLVQCFPVPAAGGTMKIRLGITAPLTMASLETGRLQWPCFLERNFSLPEGFSHSLWVESKAELTSQVPELKSEPSPKTKYALRGQLPDSLLDAPGSALQALRPNGPKVVWTVDTASESGSTIRQTMGETSIPPPTRIVLVVDGSYSMHDYLPALAKAVAQLPDGIEVAALVASDSTVPLLDQPRKTDSALREELANRLLHTKAAGGQDNVPALLQGWDLAGESPAVVVWIHGPQPVLLSGAEKLEQRLLWRAGHTQLYDVQTVAGPNRILEQLDGIMTIKPLPRQGKLQADLERLFTSWNGKGRAVEFVRERMPPSSFSPSASSDPLPAAHEGKEVSQHLARLWALGEVKRLVTMRLRDAAVKLAGNYQLVTPVSGAVVLETRQQYERHGLQPVSAESVPSVPEPVGLWWLAAGLCLAVAGWRKQWGRSLKG